MRGILIALALVFSSILLPAPLGASTLWRACEGVTDSAVCDGKDEQADDFISTLMDVLIWVVGILAILMIIWGGMKYVLSGGSAEKITNAKNTILYAVIGLVVAIFAYAVITWLIGYLQDDILATSS